MSKSVRIRWIDQAKGIGILLVVGHALADKHIFMSLYKLIYAFHMPLFFCLSGYVWSSKVLTFSFYYALEKNFKQLLVPYLFFGLSCYFILLSSQCKPNKEITWQKLIQPVFELLAGLDARLSCGHMNSGLMNAPLWFFSCLFVTQMMYYIMARYVKNDIMIIGCAIIISVIGHLYFYFGMPRLPMHADVALQAILFFSIGVFCRNRGIIAERNIICFRFIVVSLLVFFVFYFSASSNESVALSGPYGSIPLFYLAAMTGSWLVVIVARWVNSSLIGYLGFMSIVIFPAHDFIARYIYIPKVIGRIDWYSIKISEALPWFNVKYAYLAYQVTIEIVLSCLLGFFLIRFTPVLIGGRRSYRTRHNL
ncbi:MAG: acyltransferase family protein [Methylococcales bacterium]|nr:acyltransferase family protein [Methylococcales bacterium]